LFRQAIKHHQSGDFQQAEHMYRQILEIDPDNADTLHLLGVLHSQTGRLKTGSALIKKAISFNLSIPAFHANLGNALYEMGQLHEATTSFQNALQIDAENGVALNGLGMIHIKHGKYNRAEECFQKILLKNRTSAITHCNLGVVYWNLGHHDHAIQNLKEAIRLSPHYPEALNNLGNVYWDQQDYDQSIQCFERAIEQNPNFAEGYKNLAEKQWSLGDVEKAIAYYRKALKHKPLDAWWIRSTIIIPPIYQSLAEVKAYRKRLLGGIKELLSRDLNVDNAVDEIGPNFFSAYQGKNDIEIQKNIAQIYRSARIPTRKKRILSGSSGKKIKIGFISTFLNNHTIGKLNRGIIANLSRKQFHVHVFSIGSHDDDISRFIMKHADTYINLPKSLTAIQDAIEQQDLDILFFTDIGMEPLTYILAFSRMAPVQCVTWGHPMTTGIDTIDYFISTEDMETDESRLHYTENLIRLESSPTYFYRPELPDPLKGRESFGLPEDKHIYICPQSQFKFHPAFDDTLAEILRRDKNGILVLISGKYPQWDTLLKTRFGKSMPDTSDRILFLPQQTYPDFLNLLVISDVMLDTFFFGGGNTTYEGIAAGIPIVTLPTMFLRGRITYACYKKLGVLDCVASDKEEYVDIAVKLGTDFAFNREIRKIIQVYSDILFEDEDMVRKLERFFIQAVETCTKRKRSH